MLIYKKKHSRNLSDALNQLEPREFRERTDEQNPLIILSSFGNVAEQKPYSDTVGVYKY